MSGIELHSVTYHHKKQALFSDISLQIPQHCVTCLVGPNGSGKSTLLKLLAGLMLPHAGTILLDNVAISGYSRKALAKKIAYLPQQCRIPASLTVREYVALARFCHQSWFGGLNANDHAAIEDAIRLTDLSIHADRPVAILSAGQQQRARIALMLAQQAQYLLLDEPMTGLDLKQQRNMLQLLADLQQKYAKTIVVILHDLHQVMEIANEVILLKNGIVLGQGHPREMINTDFLLKAFDYECEVSSVTGNNMVYILPKPIAVRHALEPVSKA